MQIVVLHTAKTKEEAKTIAKKLVEFKLAACVNIIDQVSSIYNWEGEICDEEEVLMVIKTKKILYFQIEQAIQMHSNYEIPEVIELAIERGSKAYLDWIDKSTV